MINLKLSLDPSNQKHMAALAAFSATLATPGSVDSLEIEMKHEKPSVTQELTQGEKVKPTRKTKAQLAKMKAEAEKVETEKVETEKVETEKVETEKVETEKAEAEKAEAEKVEAEKVELKDVQDMLYQKVQNPKNDHRVENHKNTKIFLKQKLKVDRVSDLKPDQYPVIYQFLKELN